MTLAVCLAPFAVRDWGDFISGLTLPETVDQPGNRLNIPSAIFRALHRIPDAVLGVVAAAQLITVSTLLGASWRSDVGDKVFAAGVASLLVVFSARYSGGNYYLFAVSLLCWGLLLHGLPGDPQRVESP
jgi:hypothetical protein